MEEKYIVFVRFGSNEHPVIVSSELTLDSEYNINFSFSDKISEGVKFYDDGKAFKAIKKSLSYSKEYKVIKFLL